MNLCQKLYEIILMNANINDCIKRNKQLLLGEMVIECYVRNRRKVPDFEAMKLRIIDFYVIKYFYVWSSMSIVIKKISNFIWKVNISNSKSLLSLFVSSWKFNCLDKMKHLTAGSPSLLLMAKNGWNCNLYLSFIAFISTHGGKTLCRKTVNRWTIGGRTIR